jgi:PAS domain S-box-containing protein
MTKPFKLPSAESRDTPSRRSSAAPIHGIEEILLDGERRILEMVAKGEALPLTLDAVCRLVEESADGLLASVLLVDGDRLRHGAAPSLPKAYTDAIDGGLIGPRAGSCGTAAHRGEQVIVSDIASDRLWVDYRAIALPHSLRACWSTPIMSSEGRVIGTFAMYYREPRSPSRHDQELIARLTHLAGVAIERKMTHEKLERSEAYLAEAQRLTHTGTWAWGARVKKMLYCSDEMLRIFGFDPQERVPPEKLLDRIVQEDRDRVREIYRKALLEKNDFADEYRIMLSDGIVKHINVIGHPVIDESGEVVEYVGSIVDVTEHKRVQEERERLRRLEADIGYMNRISLMGELTASLAHEIKQPMAGAVASAQACARWLARDEPNVAKASDAAAKMIDAVMHAAKIIDRTRSLYGRGASEREALDLNQIIGEIAAMLGDMATRNSVLIRTDLDQQLQRTTGDRIQLQQVLLNLMRNGIEAMRSDGGKLTVTSNRTEDGQLLISVRDTGVGLPVQESERVFDPFFTTKSQGAGLGLSISRRIIESHGGRLWAGPNAVSGATFQFTLPVRRQSAPDRARIKNRK